MAKTVKELLQVLNEKETEAKLLDIYQDSSRIAGQIERYSMAIRKFEELYGDVEAEIYSAPGRSEVGGNHTDHQKGKVLACSLNLDFIAVVRPLDSQVIELKSDDYPMIRMDLSDLEINKEEYGTTVALIRGVAAGLKQAGHKVGGSQAFVTSEVLSGSGMSSSAALEILIGTIFSGLYNDMTLDRVFLAQVGQYAENVYFGKPCGLLDQMACSVGGLVYIDFKDTAKPEVAPVQVDFGKYGHSLCIVDTKGSHADLTDDYAAIPEEMKKVAAFFGKEVLREVCPADFYKNIAAVRAQCGDRAILRAMHLFAENDRAQATKEALESGDFDGFLKLIRKSGASSYQYLQNVFAVHKPQEQGISIGLAVSDHVLGDRGAFRVHGGGFAGTIQAFVPDDMVEEYRAALDSVFGEGACLVLKVRKYGGIKVIA